MQLICIYTVTNEIKGEEYENEKICSSGILSAVEKGTEAKAYIFCISYIRAGVRTPQESRLKFSGKCTFDRGCCLENKRISISAAKAYLKTMLQITYPRN